MKIYVIVNRDEDYVFIGPAFTDKGVGERWMQNHPKDGSVVRERGNVLFTPECHATIAAIAGLAEDLYVIVKHSSGSIPQKK